MKLKDIKKLIILVSLFIIVIVWIPYLRSIIIRDSNQQFLAMGIIGKNNNIEDYYINNNTEIKFGSNNYWSVLVTNNMDAIQYLDIKVKLLSYGDTLPDSKLCYPSSAITIYDIPFFIDKASTVYHNFTWSIERPKQNISVNDTVIKISVVNINNTKYPVSLSFPVVTENNFTWSRIVFELWSYNEGMNTFNFTINTPTKETCVWNQLFFKISLRDPI